MKTKILSPLRRDGYKAGMIMMLIALSTMLLTTACSNQDDVVNNAANTETVANKGYALPVTVNVTRGGDATRATFDGSKLNFSDGDKLFVEGSHTETGQFAGELIWQSGGTFSGTIYTQNLYEGTADALFTAASASGNVNATLLPNGYKSYNFLSIWNNSSDLYDDGVAYSLPTAFVASETAKATGVEQLSWEKASTYSSGFALAPENAVLNFTISGLEAGAQDVTLSIVYGGLYTVTGSVTPNASGVATFAIGVPAGANIKDMENNLTVGTHNFTLPSSTTFAAGKIYNISRNVKEVIWNSSKVAGIDIVSGDSEYNSFESDGITVAAFAENGSYFMGSEMSVDNGYFTFTSSVGNIKKIEINYTGDAYWDEPSDGWSLVDGTFTWEGDDPATSVTLSSSGYAGITDITSIVFTLE